MRHVVVLAVACLVLPAAHSQPAAAPGFNSASQVYLCASGVRFPVVYLNIQGGDSFATAYVSGTLTLMRSGPTGSGANYTPVDVKAPYRWQVKGELGNLWRRAADPNAPEALVEQDCKAQRAP